VSATYNVAVVYACTFEFCKGASKHAIKATDILVIVPSEY